MRTWQTMTVMSVAFFPMALYGEERPDALVKAAIVAAGGTQVLAKLPAGRIVGTGVMWFAGKETTFQFEHAYSLPGQLRSRIVCKVNDQPWELVQVVNENGARQTINGQLVVLTEADLRDLKLAMMLNEVAQLAPLVSDRKFTLKPARAVNAADSPGFLVLTKGFPDLRLSFDPRSGHLIRIAHLATDPETSREVETETAYSEFKTVQGITRPTRSVVTRDGKKVAELTVEKYTPLEMIDPKAFQLEK